MQSELKSTRFHERMKLQVPLRVFYRDADKELTEETLTEHITVCGLGFTLSYPLEPRRLVRLVLPMPKNFRLFDYGKEKYVVWGVVRYLRLLESNYPSIRINLAVGTALIGGKPPASFLNDPKTLYDLKPFLRKESFWDSREMPRMKGKYIRSDEERRLIEKKVFLEIITEQGFIAETERGRTLNISESGAATLTRTKNDYPRFVIIRTEDKKNKLLAAVRAVHSSENPDFMRLHLEFITGKWLF